MEGPEPDGTVRISPVSEDRAECAKERTGHRRGGGRNQ